MNAPTYIAKRDLPFGDIVIRRGEPVPYEPGRDYRSMLRRGDIEEERPAPVQIVVIPGAAIAPGWVHLPSLDDWHQLVAAAEAHGLTPPSTSLGSLHFDLDMDGAREVIADTLRELPEEDLRAVAAELGFDLVLRVAEGTGVSAPASIVTGTLAAEPLKLSISVASGEPVTLETRPAESSSSPAGEIPATLPDTRAELAALCERLGLTVVGTGGKGFVKESDYLDAIEAERARQAAQG